MCNAKEYIFLSGRMMINIKWQTLREWNWSKRDSLGDRIDILKPTDLLFKKYTTCVDLFLKNTHTHTEKNEGLSYSVNVRLL